MIIEWIKLVNFGEYVHPKGSQLFDEKSANSIVESFHSLRGKLLRKFQGIPIFIGHPDDPEFSLNSKKIYGTIDNVKVEDDALWILVKWTEIGYELFKNQIIKYLSPRWLATKTQDGKLSPKRLVSVGLTNHPNIKCDHVTKIEKIQKRTEICSKEKTLFDSDMQSQTSEPELSEISGDNEDFIFLPSPKSSDLTNSDTVITDSIATDPIVIGVDASASAIVATATTAEENPVSSSNNASDSFESHLIPTGLNVVSQTENLRYQKTDKPNSEKILEMVFERMKNFSEKYTDAWMAVKRSNPALFSKDF